MGAERRREKSLRNGVHHADTVVWEPVYRTHLRGLVVPPLATFQISHRKAWISHSKSSCPADIVSTSGATGSAATTRLRTTSERVSARDASGRRDDGRRVGGTRFEKATKKRAREEKQRLGRASR